MMKFGKFLLLPVLLAGLGLALGPAARADEKEPQPRAEERHEHHALIVPYDYDPWFYDPLWEGPGYYPYYPPRPALRVVPEGMIPVELRVQPRRATVVLDGNDLGQARDFDSVTDPLWLGPGEHRLTLRAPGYETLTVRLDTGKAVHSRLHYRLRKGNGTDPRSVVELTARSSSPAARGTASSTRGAPARPVR